MAGNALEVFQMSLQFDQYHNKDRHDGREIEKFPRYDPPKGRQLFKDGPPQATNFRKVTPQQKCRPPLRGNKRPAPYFRFYSLSMFLDSTVHGKEFPKIETTCRFVVSQLQIETLQHGRSRATRETRDWT